MSSVRFRFRVRAKSPSARFMHFGSGTRRAGQQTALNGRVADWLLGWLVSCPSDRWIVGVRPSGPPPCSMLPDPQSPLESSDPLSLFIHSVERRRSLYLNNVWPKFEFCARCLCVVLFFPPDKKVLVTNKSLAEKSTMSFISLVFFSRLFALERLLSFCCNRQSPIFWAACEMFRSARQNSEIKIPKYDTRNQRANLAYTKDANCRGKT